MDLTTLVLFLIWQCACFDHFGAIFNLAVGLRAGYRVCLQVMERSFWRGGDKSLVWMH